MRLQNSRDGQSKKLLVVFLIVSLVSGLVGGVLGALFFARPGPQGERGLQGTDGPAGTQGTSGTDGINSILQIVQNTNVTAQDTSSYTAMQWFNMSAFDPLMSLAFNIQQNSRIFVQFSAAAQLAAPGEIRMRVVVDNSLNSTVSMISVGPPSAGIFRLTTHIEFLTGPLSSGQHTISVQFLREVGSPIMLDRTVTVMEIVT